MRFLVDGLQVWASYLDQNNDGLFGVRFLWTEDGTMDMRTVALETDPDILNRLQRIWVVYQQRLDETVFSV